MTFKSKNLLQKNKKPANKNNQLSKSPRKAKKPNPKNKDYKEVHIRTKKAKTTSKTDRTALTIKPKTEATTTVKVVNVGDIVRTNKARTTKAKVAVTTETTTTKDSTTRTIKIMTEVTKKGTMTTKTGHIRMRRTTNFTTINTKRNSKSLLLKGIPRNKATPR